VPFEVRVTEVPVFEMPEARSGEKMEWFRRMESVEGFVEKVYHHSRLPEENSKEGLEMPL
jgi:hypothetical protein